ncbi:RelA/SpoT family protein [Nitrosomonas oligotropha]|uniref:RelA/SpoT family protein n=1 Tax=Nitrosomonas oligotropha TaxID=42354 RepID=A0A2T5I148_9PROT|nr:RelA/SpoT domain-containing protein [Nitrosomonas oligotropha]PTQ77536.1 RelA/SpoT family protein [Nitrosomonas oligotropha]
MTDSTEPNALVAEFSREAETYTRLGATVADLLVEMLADEQVIVHSVTHRSKSIGSLTKKVTKADKTYGSLQEVTDLAAVRVTTYFALDVDKIARIVEREFDIDRPNSVDKRTSLDPDRFGYQSLHYVVTLSGARSGLVEYESSYRRRWRYRFDLFCNTLGQRSNMTLGTNQSAVFQEISDDALRAWPDY